MFKKTSPTNKWDAHVTGEVKFTNKNRITNCEALYASITFKVIMSKGDRSFELNLTAGGDIVESENQYTTAIERFYKDAVVILQNRKGELDMALKKMIERKLKYHFEEERTKSHKAIFMELIKEPIHIKMDIKMKDEDVFPK